MITSELDNFASSSSIPFARNDSNMIEFPSSPRSLIMSLVRLMASAVVMPLSLFYLHNLHAQDLSQHLIEPISEPSLQETGFKAHDESSALADNHEGRKKAEHEPHAHKPSSQIHSSQVQHIQVMGNRVRLRVAPQLDAPVVRELDKGTPLEVTGENDEFYAVRSPVALKAYVFRTYVLDGKIEGQRVNIRLEPSPQGTIVSQMSTGQAIKGKPSSQNSKWLEIDLPETVRFYISKDYVQALQPEEYAQAANEWRQKLAKVGPSKSPSTASSEDKATPKKDTQSEASKLEPELNRWQRIENELEKSYLNSHKDSSLSDYNTWQLSQSKSLSGVLHPYEAPAFAPGDFILRQDGRIIGIVYSANLKLEHYQGVPVRLVLVERERQGFAYPTYCVLSVERINP